MAAPVDKITFPKNAAKINLHKNRFVAFGTVKDSELPVLGFLTSSKGGKPIRGKTFRHKNEDPGNPNAHRWFVLFHIKKEPEQGETFTLSICTVDFPNVVTPLDNPVPGLVLKGWGVKPLVSAIWPESNSVQCPTNFYAWGTTEDPDTYLDSAEIDDDATNQSVTADPYIINTYIDDVAIWYAIFDEISNYAGKTYTLKYSGDVNDGDPVVKITFNTNQC